MSKLVFPDHAHDSLEGAGSLAGRLADGACIKQEPAHCEDVLVPELFSRQAKATPNAPAVMAGATALSYAELEAASNRLAHRLRSLNVGPEMVVGLCMPRSPEFVIGALAILKTGGAYLPLDPSYPESRLGFMLSDAGVCAVVAEPEVAHRLPAGSWSLVSLREATQQANSPADAPPAAAKPQNLAYVIYTSGSTGQPKGVEITHRGLLNLVLWHQHEFGITPCDRATQLSSPGFDAAVWELWPHLTAGASVHIADETTRMSATALRDWLIQQNITITFVPPALAEQMISFTWAEDTVLRILLTGADVLRRYPPLDLPFALVNNYGPTECTVVATSGWICPDGHDDRPPAIGRPIANTEALILDENLQPVPPGVTGELYIGGPGVARGYRNRHDLSKERFIVHPFSQAKDARLFRTGDLARYLPDGQIEFLGRIDEQIKIRGYRIEPNEIVTALSRHPAIHSSFLQAREDASGEKQLVAYLVCKPDVALGATELRTHLSQFLPEYMLPGTFVRLETLPLNANGKVDRAALPVPNTSNILRDSTIRAPMNSRESQVAEMLAGLLEIGEVSVDDNFFMLGGHSLLGTQLITRIRETFGVELTLRNLFDHPTVSGLAAEIELLLHPQAPAPGSDSMPAAAVQRESSPPVAGI